VDALSPLVPEFETVERARPCLHPLAAFRAPGRPGVSRKEAVTRRSAFFTALPALLLAACAPAAPVQPPPELPTIADYRSDRECACLTGGDCAVPEATAFDGQGETRNAQCRWEDRAAGRADCTWESRSREAAAGSAWSPWGQTRVRFRHTGSRGWCWYESAARNELTTDAPLGNRSVGSAH
jgi:hypothetical protein